MQPPKFPNRQSLLYYVYHSNYCSLDKHHHDDDDDDDDKHTS